MIHVIDLELTCWPREDGRKPTDIISIGHVGADWNVLTTPSQVLVQAPTPVSEYCTELTGLTQADVDKGLTFPEAMDWLARRTTGKRPQLACWGHDDESLDAHCKRYNIRNPFSYHCLNVKALYMSVFGKSESLSKACKRLGFSFYGTPHNALDDAWNTAVILSHMLYRMVEGRDKWH
jgi:inhibitor of KinA sporulation pathway (predicted exonuclease)